VTASSDNPKPGKTWLRYPAWVFGSPYRKPAIFAIVLLGAPLLFRLVGGALRDDVRPDGVRLHHAVLHD
jgi:hypothetical protein